MSLRSALAVVLLSAVLGGCSSQAEEPPPLPPAPTTSPTPVVLPLPSEAAAETPQGAAAFTKYYLELLNQAFRTRDASAVRRVSDPGCGGCSNLIGAIEEPPEEGRRVEGGEYVVKFAEAPPVENGDVIVELRYSLTELRILDAAGQILDRKPAVQDVDAQMRLLRRGPSWVVAGFRDVQP